MSDCLLSACWLFLLCASVTAAAPAQRPFPQHTKYTAGTLRPSHLSAEELDRAVLAFYEKWVVKYVRPAPGTSPQLFVNANAEGKLHKGQEAYSVSEGHGYGMLATVLMAGGANDEKAHTAFDSLFRYYNTHPSESSPELMAWEQAGPVMKNIEGNDSATDGDLDIAYALLLADAQWGSKAGIDYAKHARFIIGAIKAHEVNRERWTVMLGDFAKDDKKFATAMRTSDFMTQHLKAFQDKTGDTDWGRLRDSTYTILGGLFAAYAPKTGLMPDFVVLKDGKYQPPRGKFLEDKHDGDWFYNACRTPWRLATDYLITGDERALPQLQTLNGWIRQSTGGDPHKINGGYTLAGKALEEDEGSCFYAPLAVSAMVGAPNQEWLNRLWELLLERDPDKDDDYFSNSVKLLCMVVISGNWWAP